MSRRDAEPPYSADALVPSQNHSADAELDSALRLVSSLPTPAVLWWGPEFRHVHNDALQAALDATAPGSARPELGRPAALAWPAGWAALRSVAEAVAAAGEQLHRDAVRLDVTDEAPVYWAVAAGPVPSAAGVLIVAVDVTMRVADDASARRRAEEREENLRLALDSNRRIGTAIGILMAERRVTDSAAFDLMRTISQRQHRKLRDIADEVVLTGTLPGGE